MSDWRLETGGKTGGKQVYSAPKVVKMGGPGFGAGQDTCLHNGADAAGQCSDPGFSNVGLCQNLGQTASGSQGNCSGGGVVG